MNPVIGMVMGLSCLYGAGSPAFGNDFVECHATELLRQGFGREAAAFLRDELAVRPAPALRRRLHAVEASLAVPVSVARDCVAQAERLCRAGEMRRWRPAGDDDGRATLERALALLDGAAVHLASDEGFADVLARCLVYLDRPDVAQSRLLALVARRPDDVTVMNALAWFYRSRGDGRRELKTLNRSVALVGDQPDVQARRCHLLLALGGPAVHAAAAEAAVTAAAGDMHRLAELASTFPPGMQREALESMVRDDRIMRRRTVAPPASL